MTTGSTSIDSLPAAEDEPIKLKTTEVGGDRFAEEIASLSSQGALQVPQHDIPTDSSNVHIDRQADPLYIPEPVQRTFAEEHVDYIGSRDIPEHSNSDVWAELRGPLLSGLVFMVLSSATISRLLKKNMPFAFASDGDMMPIALGAMSVIAVGMCYAGERALDSFVTS